MDFLIDVIEAKSIIGSIFDLAPAKTTQNYDPGVEITVDEKKGIVSFYLGDSSVCIKNETKVIAEKSGSIKVELRSLYKTIGSFVPFKDGSGTKEVRFFTGNNKLNIVSTTLYSDSKVRNERTLPSYDISMPDISKFSGSEVSTTVEFEEFLGKIKKVIVSAPTKASVGVPEGILFESTGKGFKFVCTDGPTLTEVSGKCSNVVEKEVSVLLPPYFLSKLAKHLNRYLIKENRTFDVSLSVYGKNKFFIFKYKTLYVVSPIINTPFRNYEKVFELKEDKSIVLGKDIFLDNLRNISHTIDINDNNRITVQSFGDEIKVSSKDSVNDGIPVFGGSAVFSVDFDVFLLEKCVRNVSSDKFLFVNEGKKPCVIQPYDKEETLRMVVVPLR